ncbi:hypothetical protein L1049_007740 [Liquidambar formosana]|uniref:Uncharacterized protein n=1 Tax=Liquidambar formosana TaxID=63359 RepID=A0AAP0X1T5_LIQFO
MAQPSCTPVASPVPVISPLFCTPYPVDLAIVRKFTILTDGNYVVKDANGNILFKVKGSFLDMRNRRVLLDAAGNPIVTLRQKIMSAHSRWKVFRGDSSDTDQDLLFSAKQSSFIQLKTKLDVFLASNTAEEVCDFKVRGSWWGGSCVIYAGDSSTIVAEMHKKQSIQSLFLGKDKFMVTVHPNMDYAFIVALIVILDYIKNEG